MTEVRRVATGAPWEPVVGYSRAVAAGDFVFVSGCTSLLDGRVVHPGDAYEQTVQAIRNLETALAALGGTLDDVIRTRIFVTDIGRWEEYGRAHGELLGVARPATSMVQIAALIDPQMLVEVEAVAYRPEIAAGEPAGPGPVVPDVP